MKSRYLCQRRGSFRCVCRRHDCLLGDFFQLPLKLGDPHPGNGTHSTHSIRVTEVAGKRIFKLYLVDSFLVWAEADSASLTAAASQFNPILASATLLIMSSLTLKQKFSMNDYVNVQQDFKSNEKVAIRRNAGPR